jgi:hypothetical protein
LKEFKDSNRKAIDNICKFMDIDMPFFDSVPMNVSFNEKRIELLRKLNHIQKSSLNPKGFIPVIWKIRPVRIYDTIHYFVNELKGRSMEDNRTNIEALIKDLRKVYAKIEN